MHILFAFAQALLLAQAPAAQPTGRLVERVVCPSDPTQTYTLYLPRAYRADRKWPLLFVFDPRGRGTLAAEIFQEAAETYGWIVASSDNTQSDGEWEPNRRALAAMWPDVTAAYSVDPKRIYAAGFSGGATVAWVLGRATGTLAGVIASGAPDPGGKAPTPVHFAWFGSAGRAGFNYLDAKAIDRWMDKAGNPHRLEYLDGVHQWLPPAFAMRAAGWMESLAMRDGLRPRDEALAAALLGKDMARARGLETSKDFPAAVRAYASIVETYDGLGDVTAARVRLQALENDEDATRARREEARTDERERARKGEFGAVLVLFMRNQLDTVPQILDALHIRSLRRAAEGDDYEAASARRTLEQIYVQVAFYVWRDMEAAGDFRRAAMSLELAVAIHPDRPVVWVNLAGDRARMGAKGGALKALGQAVEAGYTDAAELETDERFAALRQAPEFTALLQKLKR